MAWHAVSDHAEKVDAARVKSSQFEAGDSLQNNAAVVHESQNLGYLFNWIVISFFTQWLGGTDGETNCSIVENEASSADLRHQAAVPKGSKES
jgi:hypothetical protein